METNVDVTFKKVSYSHLIFLRIVALIPFEGRQLNFIGTQLLSVYFHLIAVMYTSNWVIYGVKMIAQKNWEVEFICEFLTVCQLYCRYILLYAQREKLGFLISLCKELWSYLSTDEIGTIKLFERKAYYFRNFVLFNSYFVASIFIISTEIVNHQSAAVNGTGKKKLPFRFWMDVQEEPCFTIIKSLQIIVDYSMTLLVPAMETAGLYLTMMACGYLRSVQNRLLSFAKQDKIPFGESIEMEQNENNLGLKSLLDEVLDCAKFHQKIMVFCEEIERFTRTIFLVVVFASVYNMSVAGLTMTLKKDENKYNAAALFILNIFLFFTCQWSPENLLMESAASRNAAYFAGFGQSTQNNEINRILLFVMLRAHKPVQLTAGGFVNLSMETFAAMLKNAFSFFTLIRNFTN